jgi:hypothetical protein
MGSGATWTFLVGDLGEQPFQKSKTATLTLMA